MFKGIKKAGLAIGTTIAFIGVASFTIFFMETSLNTNAIGPAAQTGNLSADISQNAPDAAANDDTADIAQAAPDDGSADAPADVTAPTTAPADAAPVATPAPVSDTDATAVTPDAAATTDTASATAPVVSPAAQSQPATQPPTPPTPPSPTNELPVLALTATTSTDAMVTITVTPDVPANAPPLPPETSAPPTQSTQNQTATDLVLPYGESNFTSDANWQTIWGNMSFTPSGAMDMTAGAGSTGGSVYLKNSASWTDYAFNATVDWVAGKSFGLMADYKDQGNYILCEYTASSTGATTMQLAQYRAGQEISLAPSVVVANGGPEAGAGIGAEADAQSDDSASIKVNGETASCSLDGTTITNSGIGPGIQSITSISPGGIGFTMQDPNPNVSEIIVKEVEVAGEF